MSKPHPAEDEIINESKEYSLTKSELSDFKLRQAMIEILAYFQMKTEKTGIAFKCDEFRKIRGITPTNWYDHSQQQINWFLSNLTILNNDVSLDVLKKG